MFKFANPEYLYLLALVPVLVALHIISNIRRRRKLAEYGDGELLAQLMPDVSGSTHACSAQVGAYIQAQFTFKGKTQIRCGYEQ